ncbi:MAG: formyltetrahydrofolate deformylase [Proteobacteria bacterium]|nr:formyltetrahydrofolate deformylase [Pseudomonadota bacterium]MBU1595844.1 formyltetrahydrofolate deformylase [Pseudomonadota bacterium]
MRSSAAARPQSSPAQAGCARLLATCPDRSGIVAAVSGFLHQRGVNIIHSDQHSTDPEGGRFFMRQEFYLPGLEESIDALARDFGREVAERYQMSWRVVLSGRKKRVAVLVSRLDHALMDLLWRVGRGELHAEIPLVISNHPDLRPAVESFGVDFHHVHVPEALDASRGRSLSVPEEKMLELLEGQPGGPVETLVLARYMRILSPAFVKRFPQRIINIHHSFLPAFEGADPYRRASERGVKLIGATAHYVTGRLDKGPIIEQDVIRVSHRHRLDELKILGRDIERQVLSRAVRWHLEDRVLVDGNKTIVFA